MVKRISVVILLFFISFNLIDVYGYQINNNWDIESTYDEFNYIYLNQELDDDYIYYLRYYPVDNNLLSGNIEYQYRIIGQNRVYTLDLKYNYNNYLGNSFKIYLDDELIYDLEFSDMAYLYKASSYYFESNYKLELIESNNEFVKYINVSPINFINIDNIYEYNIKTSSLFPIDSSELYNMSLNNHDNIKDIYLSYNDYIVSDIGIKEGNYKIIYAILDYYNNVCIDIYYINVYENKDYFYCDDINVDFSDLINSNKIFNNFIHYYNKDNIKSFEIISDYFKTPNVIGKYKYNAILYTYDNEIIRYELDSYINVIDSSIPYIEILDIGYGNGNYKSINIIFKDAKAYDLKEGDITNKIKIIDLDNYENNYDKEGIYNFLISVRDSYGNKCELLVPYEIIINKEEEKEDIIEDNEDINEIKTEYDFYFYKNNKIDVDEFINKLIFSGFYNINDNLIIESDYFSNL